MRRGKIILCLTMIFFVSILSGCGGAVKGAFKSAGKGVGKIVEKTPSIVKRNAADIAEVAYDAASDNPTKTVRPNAGRSVASRPSVAARAGVTLAGGAAVANEIFSDDNHWIQDTDRGAYVWSPEPLDGESVRWIGSVVREGNNLYAQGRGTLTWYKAGHVIQTDDGTFERGKPNGQFRHTFPSGNVEYSNWDHGTEIPLAKPTDNLAGTLNAKDLSLGTLSIDDRADKLQAALGTPLSVTTDSDGGRRLTFRDIEVVVRNGKISALVSLSPVCTTPRGIREGSSVQEVFDSYGTNCAKSSYARQTLYEYAVISADGHPCYLRFAVNASGTVAYISERFIQ